MNPYIFPLLVIADCFGARGSALCVAYERTACFQNETVTRNHLAKEACHIEMDVLGEPIGKQDQYAAAFGGFNMYQFNDDTSVDVRGVDVSTDYLSKLLNSMSLHWTGLTRSAGQILAKQKANFRRQVERGIIG